MAAAAASLHVYITRTIYTWSVVWLQFILADVTCHVVTIRLCHGKAYTRRPGQHRWGATPTAPDANPVLHFTTGKLVVQSVVPVGAVSVDVSASELVNMCRIPWVAPLCMALTEV